MTPQLPDPRRGAADARRLSADARRRSLARHQRRLDALALLRRRLRRRLRLWLLALLATAAAAAVALWLIHPHERAPPPQRLAAWVQQQQMIELLAQVQAWVEQGQASSDAGIDPNREPVTLQELVDYLNRLTLEPELLAAPRDADGAGEQAARFQCPTRPLACGPEDMPRAPGEARPELAELLVTANYMLVQLKDCDGAARLLGEFGSLHGWRAGEAIRKARAELALGDCYQQIGDDESWGHAAEHYERSFCASVNQTGPEPALNALFGLARAARQRGDLGEVRDRVACGVAFVDYYRSLHGVNQNALWHYLNLAVMYAEFLYDFDRSIAIQEDVVARLKPLLGGADELDRLSLLGLLLTLQMNLLEGYLLTGRGEDLYALYDELLQNPTAAGSDVLIALGLVIMQKLSDRRYDEAADLLDELIVRYRSAAEYVSGWSWLAFDNWRERTAGSRDAGLDAQIGTLRDVLSPPRSDAKLALLQQVRRWAGER